MSDFDDFDDFKYIPIEGSDFLISPLLKNEEADNYFNSSYESIGAYNSGSYEMQSSPYNNYSIDNQEDLMFYQNETKDELETYAIDDLLMDDASQIDVIENNEENKEPEKKQEMFNPYKSEANKIKRLRGMLLYGKEKKCFKCKETYDMNYFFIYNKDKTMYIQDKPFICFWCALAVNDYKMLRDWEIKPKNPLICYRCRCKRSKCRIKTQKGKQNYLCCYCSLKKKLSYESKKRKKMMKL